MYPAIKGITAAAPSSKTWDKMVTRDVIRTLCWDWVRSRNRRVKDVVHVQTDIVRNRMSENPAATNNPSWPMNLMPTFPTSRTMKGCVLP